MVPGGVTVALVGMAAAVQPHLAVIARHMPDISHVAVHLADVDEAGHAAAIPPEQVDQLELSGIRLTVAGSPADAVFGANLVIVAGHGPAREYLDALRLGQFARGAVLVNATGHDLPRELVDRVDDVYVDDLGLLAAHSGRYVVAAHVAAASEDRGVAYGREPRIVGDLGLLLTGGIGQRRRVDGIVLVELLGVTELSTELADRICEAARQAGLGSLLGKQE
jgi:ornithine cyclodeaminase/alanine dehydrogenase-like protein (mu-crystallin family)